MFYDQNMRLWFYNRGIGHKKMELDVLKYKSFGKIIELEDIRISLLPDSVVIKDEKQRNIKTIEISKTTKVELKKLLNIKPPDLIHCFLVNLKTLK